MVACSPPRTYLRGDSGYTIVQFVSFTTLDTTLTMTIYIIIGGITPPLLLPFQPTDSIGQVKAEILAREDRASVFFNGAGILNTGSVL